MSKTKKFVMEKGYYEILETSPTATTSEIQRSFERLCEEHINIHDEDLAKRRESAEILFTLTKAYDILTDPFQRLSYDERRFNGKFPQNNEVETIFKEGLKAFRANNVDTAIKFFKEAVILYPHKTIYRVNLAIAYQDKGMLLEAKKQLRMSLKLDPQNEFAKEVVAKILFSVSDRNKIGFLTYKVNRQITLVVAGFVLFSGVLLFGIPKINALFSKKVITAEMEHQIALQNKNKLPQDLREAIDRKTNSGSSNNTMTNTVSVSSNTSSNGLIQKLDDNFKLSGQVSDYSNQEATKKTYYKDQGMVMVEYKNGSILSYKIQDVQGWKNNTEKNVPVIITKGNEIIPVPTSLPITLSGGKVVNPGDPDFPAEAFPEYGIEPKQKTDNDNVSNQQQVQPVSNDVQPNNTIPTEISTPKQESINIPKNNESETLPSIGLPPPPGKIK